MAMIGVMLLRSQLRVNHPSWGMLVTELNASARFMMPLEFAVAR